MIYDEDPVATHWRLDKRIPIALVLVLVGQFAAGVAAFTKVQSDQAYMRERMDLMSATLIVLNQKATEMEGVKVEMRFLNEGMRRLRTMMDRVTEDRYKNRDTKK